MDKFNNLLEELNQLEIIQKSIDWEECIPEEIYLKHFKDNFKILKYNLEPDEHRHYQTSVSVINIYNRILGIRHITNVFSESSCCEDCFVTIKFFEMKEISIITYIPIK